MDLIRTALQHVRPDSLILDIGANIGGHTWLFLQGTAPSVRIDAFEPIPALARGVQARYQGEPRVTVYPLGMSDHAYDEPEMSIYEAWTLEVPGKSPRGPSLGAIEQVGEVFFPVRFTTVDAHVDARPWRWVDENHTIPVPDRVDFLKIDTDGFEHRVLRGAQALLMRDRPAILLEVGYLIEDKGDSIPEFLGDLYRRWGYTLVAQDGTVWGDWEVACEKYPYHTTFDVIALPRERAREFRWLD